VRDRRSAVTDATDSYAWERADAPRVGAGRMTLVVFIYLAWLAVLAWIAARRWFGSLL
jgi:hypothetical protein